MFVINPDTMEIRMHRGDTGAFTVTASRESGAEWTDADRMIFTVTDGTGAVKMERYYRLDNGRTSVELDPGVVLVEFHNDDTDDWSNGTYQTELRFVIDAVWDGEAPEDDMISALNPDTAHIIEGSGVRTALQSTMILNNVLAEV